MLPGMTLAGIENLPGVCGGEPRDVRAHSKEIERHIPENGADGT